MFETAKDKQSRERAFLIRLSVQEHNALLLAAKKEQMTAADFVRTAIHAKLRKRK